MFYIDVAEVARDIAHVAMVFSSVCPKCFICFRRMFQVFHPDVAKVDLDVAYTCMLQAYVSSVFRCFICMFASVSSMLHMFLLVFKCFSRRFRKCFRYLFQVFHMSYFVCYNCCI